MRKLKEVCGCHSLGLSQHQIARSYSISQSTVHEYVSTAQAAGIGWPLPDAFVLDVFPASWNHRADEFASLVMEAFDTIDRSPRYILWIAAAI